MYFLPVVQRELATAAKRPGTARVRWWTALISIVMSAGFLMLAWGLGPGYGMGETCFNLQTYYLFGLCLLSGVFLTADCLSEEKREGTIGLLFLTDLEGYDIVLGKFAATALNAFYAVMALLPIAALPLLLGGVTGTEFWRVALVQLNALFISLAAGMAVSAYSRDSQRAMGWTLCLLVFVVVGVPAFAQSLGGKHSVAQWVGWLSPASSLALAKTDVFGAAVPEFWGALIVSNLFGWICLVIASLQLRHGWMDEDANAAPKALGASWFGRIIRAAQGGRPRGKLLDLNPAFWMLRGRSPLRVLAWGIVVLWSGCELLFLYTTGKAQSFLMLSYVRPFGLLLKIVFVFQACRFFVESRQGGALELLLCTPLTQTEILQGHVRAFRQTVLWPSVGLAGILLLPIWITILTGKWDFQSVFGVLSLAFFCVRLAADLAAICWVGMRLSLSLKNPKWAPALTILVVIVVPSILCVLDVIADLVLIAWARSGLLRDWRQWLVTGNIRPPLPVTKFSVPPVIQTGSPAQNF